MGSRTASSGRYDPGAKSERAKVVRFVATEHSGSNTRRRRSELNSKTARMGKGKAGGFTHGPTALLFVEGADEAASRRPGLSIVHLPRAFQVRI